MATTTTRLALRKPAGTDTVNVATDINASMDTIDTVVGFTNASSSTRPSTPFTGQGVLESDTGAAIVSNGSSPASGSWTYLIGTGGPTTVGATAAVGAIRVQTTSTIGGNRFVDARKSGDANAAYTMDFDGKNQWGPGGGTALDTNLYRSAAATLKTDSSFIVAGSETVSGNLTVTGTATVSGFPVGAIIGGKRYVTVATLATTSGTTEILSGVDTGAVSLDANSHYFIFATLHYDITVTNDIFDFLIRDTNVSGTVRYEACNPPVQSGNPLVVHLMTDYKTSSAEPSKTFVVTMKRVSGSGTCSVKADATGMTHIKVMRAGPSTIMTDV